MQQRHVITAPKHRLKGIVRPPGSKSISNRILLIQALTQQDFEIKNLSKANDTVTLQRLIRYQNERILDAGDAGTTFRFMTAFLALQSGKHVLTGSRRMLERPIGILVEALRELGADVKYLAREGYPPLQLGTPQFTGKDHLRIQAHVSSQFITALLLIAPTLPQGLTLHLEGEVVSRPYIEMTLRLMAEFGILYSWRIDDFQHSSIFIPPQVYQPRHYWVEADWSAASYYYAMVALSEDADILVEGLFPDSLQGDAKIAQLMRDFGVVTRFSDRGAHLSRGPRQIDQQWECSCLDCPDLAQTLAVVCAGLGIEARLTGLQTLRIKETDRIAALQHELGKLGSEAEGGEDYLHIRSGIGSPKSLPMIQTYNDHRMAMAFAPLAISLGSMAFDQREVVQKSYPHFWEDLSKLGFR